MDGEAARMVSLELTNQGIDFTPSDAYYGPGVRLVHNRPTLLRRPTVVTKWEGVPLEVEFQGQAQVVFVSREALADLATLASDAPDDELLKAAWQYRGQILEAAWRQMLNPAQMDKLGRVFIRTTDLNLAALMEPRIFASINLLFEHALVRLDPLPRRIWRGVEGEPQDHVWWVRGVDRERGAITIANESTGHYLWLFYPAHVWSVERAELASGNRANFVLQLSVQVVFEDGHARLERLPTSPSR